MAKARKTVALLVETSNDYARGILHGIIAYIREHRPWSAYLAEHGRGDTPPNWLSHWKGDGIIARIENERIAQVVSAAGLPAVDVSAANLLPGIPWVETNDDAIAKAALDHLLERGFKHLAFCGDDRYNWSEWRGQSFTRYAEAAGFKCHILNSTAKLRISEEWGSQVATIAAWVRKLPKPVGVMACFDLVGRQVLEACRSIDVAVPDEVAVVGVDDDELLCELSDPPLSSVAPDTHRTGYLAASLLDQLMSGKEVSQRVHRIVPIGLIVRESSDVLAIDDQDISQAVRFIREHACEGINVGDVLKQVPLSRRVLESRFRRLIGRTPHDEIDRVRLNRVKELLRGTDLPLVQVAQRAGFEHVEYLSVVFKKKAGIPPSEYRRQSQH